MKFISIAALALIGAVNAEDAAPALGKCGTTFKVEMFSDEACATAVDPAPTDDDVKAFTGKIKTEACTD